MPGMFMMCWDRQSVLKNSRILGRIIHDQWIMRAIFMIYLDKLVYTQKHPAFRFQLWSCFESEHLEVYRGFGGV